MKRSARISLHLVPVVSAAFLAACESHPQQRSCLDREGRVVQDTYCATPQTGQGQSGASGSFGPGSPGGPYRWYWYRGAHPYFVGSHAPGGGSFNSPSTSSSSSRSVGSTTRGGFGSTASGSSGG